MKRMNRMVRETGYVGALLLLAGSAVAQSPTPGGMPAPPGMSLAASAALRFPQPVRAGDLIGRVVIRPVESQDLVGTVRSLVRGADGGVQVVIELDNILGFGIRQIAVPIDAMVLVGDVMEVVAYTPEQLRRFPAFDPANTTSVTAESTLRVGLAKPSH